MRNIIKPRWDIPKESGAKRIENGIEIKQFDAREFPALKDVAHMHGRGRIDADLAAMSVLNIGALEAADARDDIGASFRRMSRSTAHIASLASCGSTSESTTITTFIQDARRGPPASRREPAHRSSFQG